MRAKLISSRVVSSLAFVFCASGASAAVIDPVDSEKLGTLNVTMADPTAPFSGHVPTFQFSSMRTPAMALKLGTPVRVLATNRGKLVLSYANHIRYTLETSVVIAEGQNLDMVVPQLRVEWNDNELATDIGPVAGFAVNETGKPVFYGLPLQDSPAKALSGGMPVFPGSYEFQTFPTSEIAKPTTVGVSWGQSLPVVLSSDRFEKRAVLKLVFPEAKLPTPKVYAHCQQDTIWMTAPPAAESYYNKTWQPTLVPDAHEQRVRFFPGAKELRTYTLHTGSITVPVKLEPGQEFTGFFDRIEVNKMKVIREDGTDYVTDVEYEIELQQGPRWLRYTHSSKDCTGRSQLRAPAGVYVPKGVYRVTLSYRTEEGPKQQVHVLDLSK